MHFLDSNPSSMFLKAADKKDNFDIVSKCKNKRSTDWNDIDMALIKDSILIFF